jgi:hypothetical protein
MEKTLRGLKEVDLSTEYEQVSSQLRADNTVGDEWNRFEQTVHRERLPDGGVLLYRTVDAQVRGLKKKKKVREMGETRFTLTTMPKTKDR